MQLINLRPLFIDYVTGAKNIFIDQRAAIYSNEKNYVTYKSDCKHDGGDGEASHLYY